MAFAHALDDATIFREYEPREVGRDGYPLAWHDLGEGRGVKHLVREAAGNRCARCGHPYEPGMGEWSPCDEHCTHGAPYRLIAPGMGVMTVDVDEPSSGVQHWRSHGMVHARWRILTVHHLRAGDEAKRDLRWFNLAPLCQRDHLLIQRKVVMENPWPWEHSSWFKPHAAAWYALRYLGENLTYTQTLVRLDELLALGRDEECVERMAL
jgi:hypothetical protein